MFVRKDRKCSFFQNTSKEQNKSSELDLIHQDKDAYSISDESTSGSVWCYEQNFVGLGGDTTSKYMFSDRFARYKSGSISRFKFQKWPSFIQKLGWRLPNHGNQWGQLISYCYLGLQVLGKSILQAQQWPIQKQTLHLCPGKSWFFIYRDKQWRHFGNRIVDW